MPSLKQSMQILLMMQEWSDQLHSVSKFMLCLKPKCAMRFFFWDTIHWLPSMGGWNHLPRLTSDPDAVHEWRFSVRKKLNRFVFLLDMYCIFTDRLTYFCSQLRQNYIAITIWYDSRLALDFENVCFMFFFLFLCPRWISVWTRQ